MTWKELPGLGNDIGIGKDGTVWIVGTNAVRGGYGLWYWDGGTWIPDPANGGGVRIAVAPDGHPWVVNDAHEIYERVNGTWVQHPGSGTDIAVGGDGSVWKIGTTSAPGGYEIAKWTGADWQPVDGGGVRIAVDTQGLPWVVNSAHEIYRRLAPANQPAYWQQVPNRTATDIAISGTGSEGLVWVIGADTREYGYGIYSWTGSGWAPDPDNGSGVAIAVAPDTEPWVVNNQSNIYQGIGVVPT